MVGTPVGAYLPWGVACWVPFPLGCRSWGVQHSPPHSVPLYYGAFAPLLWPAESSALAPFSAQMPLLAWQGPSGRPRPLISWVIRRGADTHSSNYLPLAGPVG